MRPGPSRFSSTVPALQAHHPNLHEVRVPHALAHVTQRRTRRRGASLCRCSARATSASCSRGGSRWSPRG
eukprot:3314001-Pleurochrysis_carterae.AAC.1